MLLIDAHEDLAYNMLRFGRDYTRAAAETRRLESGGDAPAHNGDTLLGWPDYQRGQTAVVFGTLFAAPRRRHEENEFPHSYADIPQARRLYSAQLDAYHRLADQHPDQFCLIENKKALREVLSKWNAFQASLNPAALPPPPVGIVVLMEGAEAVDDPGELEEWWQRGVRWIGPAWAGTRFCGGTREPGPLTSAGFALLEGMASFGFGLDLSHMDSKAALQALDSYPGVIIASHANVDALLKGIDTNRHLPDVVIHKLIERDGVIGVIPYNNFLRPGWKRGDSRHLVSLQHLVAHIDAICQMAGSARHVGIGSDFDGGFGVQCAPLEIDTIADLQKLVPLLAEKGYTETDIAAILGGNWQTKLNQVLR